MKMSSALFVRLCVSFGIPAPQAEFRFHPTRKWRMDYCWPEQKLGLEVDGGVWTGGRHTRGGGWHRDTEKLNAAAALGWRMLRCTPDQLATSETLELIKTALNPKEEAAA